MHAPPDKNLLPRAWPALLPPLLLLGLLCLFPGWNVVWGDDVSMCPLFDKFYRSALTFGDLWAPYQGHRILFHRSLELLIGWATRWNVQAAIGAIYLLLLADFLLLCSLLLDLRPAVSERTWRLLVGVCSLSVFSANQVEIWSNGFNLGPALSVTCALGGAVLLAKRGAGWRTLAACLLAGVVASYSYGNGLTYWAALAPLLRARLRGDPRWREKTLLWVAVTAGTVALYFHGLGGNGTSVSFGQSLIDVFRRPGVFLAYWFTCSGASVFFLNGAKAALSAPVRALVACGAPLCGALGLGFFGWAAWRLRRADEARQALAAPWLSLGLYAALSVGLVALTRFSALPLMSAISSRYILFSQYLWLALGVCLALLAPRWPRPWRQALGGALLLCYLLSYANGFRYARATSRELRQVRAALLSQPTAETYHAINPNRDPAQVAAFMELLRRHRLALFRDAAPPDPQPPSAAR